MKPLSQLGPVLSELLGWFDLAHVVRCPECGDQQSIGTVAENEVPMIANSHGISVPMKCSRGHTWTLRISSWPSDYLNARKKLAEREPVWNSTKRSKH